MTLRDVIETRGHKYDEQLQLKVSGSEFWTGYHTGWYWAYRDLKEILEHYGFNLDISIEGDANLRDKKYTPPAEFYEVIDKEGLL